MEDYIKSEQIGGGSCFKCVEEKWGTTSRVSRLVGGRVSSVCCSCIL